MSRYRFHVHRRRPAYRLVTAATFPPEGRIEDWSFTRERDAADVNADVRRMVDETGYCLFKIGCRFDEIDDDAAG